MSILSSYDAFLRSNPLATKMLTNLFICCSGDLICQFITSRSQQESKSEQKTELDLVRTARFGAVGAGVQTTLLHWYLTRVVPNLQFSEQAFPNARRRLLAQFSLRMLVHLGTLLPFRIGAIFFALSSLQHLSFSKGLEGLKQNYFDGLKAAYCYWPFVLVGLYTVVPRRYGNLYFDSFNLVWAVALSYFASRDHTASTDDQLPSKAPSSESIITQSRQVAPQLTLQRPLSYAQAAQKEDQGGQSGKVEFIVTPRLPSERRLGTQPEQQKLYQQAHHDSTC